MADYRVHVFRDYEILERWSDGYFNGWAMCEASGVSWEKYRSLREHQRFFKRTAKSLSVGLFHLIEEANEDTPIVWIHPMISCHLARYCGREMCEAVSSWSMDRMTELYQGCPKITHADFIVIAQSLQLISRMAIDLAARLVELKAAEMPAVNQPDNG